MFKGKSLSKGHLNCHILKMKGLWRVKMERAPIAVNRLHCAAYEVQRSVDLRSHRLELSFVCGYFHASFHIATG